MKTRSLATMGSRELGGPASDEGDLTGRSIPSSPLERGAYRARHGLCLTLRGAQWRRLVHVSHASKLSHVLLRYAPGIPSVEHPFVTFLGAAIHPLRKGRVEAAGASCDRVVSDPCPLFSIRISPSTFPPVSLARRKTR